MAGRRPEKRILSDTQRSYIRRNKNKILEILLVDDVFIAELESREIIPRSVIADVKHQPVPYQKGVKLLDYVPKMNVAAFEIFLGVLCDTDQGHVAEIFEDHDQTAYRPATAEHKGSSSRETARIKQLEERVQSLKLQMTKTQKTGAIKFTKAATVAKNKMEIGLGAVNAYNVVALPSGGAVVGYRDSSNQVKLTKFDQNGKKKGRTYSCKSESYITGMLFSNPWVFIIQEDGSLTKINEDTFAREEYKKNVKTRGLYPGEVLDDDSFLLTDFGQGEVFIYTASNNDREVKIQDLDGPVHAVYAIIGDEPGYIVTEYDGCCIKLYNESWSLMRKFCKEGNQCMQLSRPLSTVLLTNGNLLVADRNNNRITELTWKGDFVKHYLTQNEGLFFPLALSFNGTTLWVVSVKNGSKKAAAYQIFE